MANALSSLTSKYEDSEDSVIRAMAKGMKIVSGLLNSVSLKFIYPTMRFAELGLKYAAFYNPVTMGYTAARLAGLFVYSRTNNNKDNIFNAHRVLKDVGRGLFGLAITQAIMNSLDDEEKEKIIGMFTSDNLSEEINTSQYLQMETIFGISIKYFGPLSFMFYLGASDLDKKKGKKGLTPTQLAIAMTASSYGERGGRIVKDLSKENPDFKVVGELLASLGMMLNPASRTMNDIASLTGTYTKNVTKEDYLKKGLGLSIFNGHDAFDFMGNELRTAQMSAYSLDGLKALVEEWQKKDEDVMKYLYENGVLDFNTKVSDDSENGLKGYMRPLGEEAEYQVEKVAGMYRGEAFRGLYGQKDFIDETFQIEQDKLVAEGKELKVSNAQREKLMRDAWDMKKMVDKNEFSTDAQKQLGVDYYYNSLLTDYPKQKYLREVVSEINNAAKYLSRYEYILNNHLENDPNIPIEWLDGGKVQEKRSIIEYWKQEKSPE